MFTDHLETLGCKVTKNGTHITVEGPETLKGNLTFNLNACSDSTPALVAISPFADGPIKVDGVEHIRSHESDRISVMNDTLVNAKVTVEEFPDGLNITPTQDAPKHVTVDPHDDHRMAMSFSVMGAAGQGATILDPTCVSKTCSNFFELLGRTGVVCKIN